MQFIFDIRKTVAASSYLCSKNGGRLTTLYLLKMLYLADREALLKWGRPITGDSFWSLPKGPILSHTYNLIQGKVMGSDMKAWNESFHPLDGYWLSSKGEPDLDPLSQRETDLLDSAFELLHDVPSRQMVAKLHELLPEWKDPCGSARPIDPKDILRAETEMSEEEIDFLSAEISSVGSAKAALEFHASSSR